MNKRLLGCAVIVISVCSLMSVSSAEARGKRATLVVSAADCGPPVMSPPYVAPANWDKFFSRPMYVGRFDLQCRIRPSVATTNVVSVRY